jgi:hypothetical protein
MGTAKVYCGSTYKGTVNNYATTARWRVARPVTCSSTTATSTLRVVATGLKGSTAGKGAGVVVDAVRVGSTTTANPAFATRWAGVATSYASARRYAFAEEAGASVSLVFRGKAVTWQTVLGTTMGRATVYLDGVKVGTFDGYASTTRYGVKRTFSKKWDATRGQWVALSDSVHTIKVVVTGAHRAGAKANRVAVDLLSVA